MNITKVVFKSHKWLAVAVSLFTFCWFFSAMFMTMPAQIERALAEGNRAEERSDQLYRSVRLGIPEAIRAGEQAAGHPLRVNNVVAQMLGGKFYYRLGTNEGTFLVDGADGSRLVITEDVARQLLVHFGARLESLGPARSQERFDAVYTWGGLPVWRIDASDSGRPVYFVDRATGEIRAIGRMGRIKTYLVGMHTLDFLNPWLSRPAINFLMWIFTLAANAMFFFGLWILWIQFVNWRARRLA